MNNNLTPLKSIRKYCVNDCCLGSIKEVRLCPSLDCHFYQFRMGKHPARKGVGNPNPDITKLKYQLNSRIRCAILGSLKKGIKNGRHWEDLTSYNIEQLKKHLKSTMPDNYSWNDFMKGNLHIDHIIPISAFNFDSPEHIDFKKCWSLENLRLLPAKENLSKHDKLDKPFQPSLKISK